MNRSIAIVTAKTVLGAGLALGFLAAPHGVAHADACTHTYASTIDDHCDVYAAEVGDDNGDGVVMEDESGWDCTTMGNRTCGPDNPQGAPVGRYDAGGVLVS